MREGRREREEGREGVIIDVYIYSTMIISNRIYFNRSSPVKTITASVVARRTGKQTNEEYLRNPRQFYSTSLTC